MLEGNIEQTFVWEWGHHFVLNMNNNQYILFPKTQLNINWYKLGYVKHFVFFIIREGQRKNAQIHCIYY